MVYRGIENRFSLRYFLGSPDDHSFIRFTSLMPRWMAQIYYKLRTGKNYFMHTHSLSGYRQMLKQIGFTMDMEYCPWPNYRNPVEFIEFAFFQLHFLMILKWSTGQILCSTLFTVLRFVIYLENKSFQHNRARINAIMAAIFKPDRICSDRV